VDGDKQHRGFGFDTFYKFQGDAVMTKNRKQTKQEKATTKQHAKIRRAALELLREPRFLFRVGQRIAEMGIVGEVQNRLTLFLAALTKDSKKSVSVLVKGPTSSGKNNLVRAVVRLLPPEWVVVRSSLTTKALAYGSESLSGKILYLFEYRGGRDAQLLTRLLQSEGTLLHEHTVMDGGGRKTQVAHREGDPVILTTCTDERVYADDETRFLSIRADASAAQTRSVLRSKFERRVIESDSVPVSVWQEACRILSREKIEFIYPDWLRQVGELIPSGEPRARRDADRFLSFLEAVARCRSFSDGRRENSNEIQISLADYAVAYEILSDAFSSTYRGVHPQALKVAESVVRLHNKLKHPVTAKEIAHGLGWKDALTYKWIEAAVTAKLAAYQEGTQPQNQKYLIPVPGAAVHFLPDPVRLLGSSESVGDEVSFLDPLTGEERKLRRGKPEIGKAEPMKTGAQG